MKNPSENIIHFISGLPRSGSTLLSSILNQNPRFTAGMTSPVSTLFKAVESATSRNIETSVFISDEQREEFLKGVFDVYYNFRYQKGRVIFDTSRMWASRLSILFKLFPDSKIICCVRELGWVLDSFERIYRLNFQKPSGIYGYDTSGTVYSRTMGLASSNGVVGYAFDALREALSSEYRDHIILVDYENLCQKPNIELARIYEFINENPFGHDFNNVEYHAGEFDKQLGAEGLHDVKGAVEWSPRETILPPDLFARFESDNFWRANARV